MLYNDDPPRWCIYSHPLDAVRLVSSWSLMRHLVVTVRKRFGVGRGRESRRKTTPDSMHIKKYNLVIQMKMLAVLFIRKPDSQGHFSGHAIETKFLTVECRNFGELICKGKAVARENL